ncbi:MAG TPA: metallopeptidase family protein [Thermoleophilaceae bacterium]|jgi:predicted Zn-dependent protease with MMP-like domain
MNDDLRPALRAAAIAAFTVGVLLMFLHPPSLSGAGGLATLVVAALAFLLIVAWGTVALAGRDGMSEEEFERLVRRSEELAREPALARDAGDFERLVADAIDRLPPDFQALLEHTPVVVSQRGAEARAYGHYFGDTVARGHYEDRIVIYQDTLERDFGYDPDVLAAQVERVLLHELAHHLGWDESGVRELGL